MSKRMVPMSAFLTMVVSLAVTSASAGISAIDTSGATPFLYKALSYIPLNSTASFLGAQLRWDAAKGQAVMTYKGEELVLTPNSIKALLAGQPVVLPSPPVVVSGVTYVPTQALRKYYHVPVAWDAAKSEVKIKGPSGWGTVKASSRAPWHGGPPPWAPAWGQRGYGTPGHPSNVKPSGSGKAKALGQRGYGAPGHPSNVKPSGSEKAEGNKKSR